VRFASGRATTSAAKGKEEFFPIEVSSARYPLVVAWPDGLPEGTELMNDGAALATAEARQAVLESAPRALGVRTGRSGAAVPEKMALAQNFPNPFNPETSIEYSIPAGASAPVSLLVYDLLGREVEVLVSATLAPGRYRASWNAANHPDGVYYYRLRIGEESETRKMVVLK
jgi:hypothetical protein